jgi:hypothetical protein
VFATLERLTGDQKGFYMGGIIIAAYLTGLDGVILRNLIVGDTPPAAFNDAASGRRASCWGCCWRSSSAPTQRQLRDQ